MLQAKEIKGVVYRMKHLTGGWLVEVPEGADTVAALAAFAAEQAVCGYIITSVTRIFPCSKDTPRMAILSSKEYKEAVKKLLSRKTGKGAPATLEEFKTRVDAAGWSCYDARDDFSTELCFELGKMSPAGEDFYIYVSGSTLESLVQNLASQASDFDEEEHVKLNMGANGAPDLATLVSDATDIHEMLHELADIVCGR